MKGGQTSLKARIISLLIFRRPVFLFNSSKRAGVDLCSVSRQESSDKINWTNFEFSFATTGRL